MAAPPVDSPAALADLEAVVPARNVRRDAIPYGFPVDARDMAIALHATCERADVPPQIQCVDNLAQLRSRCRVAQPVTVAYRAVLQYAAIPRQDDAPLAQRQLHDHRVREIRCVQRIEAGEPQVARKLPEVDVEDEARIAQRFRAQPRDAADVQALEAGIDGNVFAAPQEAIEADGDAFHENQIDLGMR